MRLTVSLTCLVAFDGSVEASPTFAEKIAALSSVFSCGMLNVPGNWVMPVGGCKKSLIVKLQAKFAHRENMG